MTWKPSINNLQSMKYKINHSYVMKEQLITRNCFNYNKPKLLQKVHFRNKKKYCSRNFKYIARNTKSQQEIGIRENSMQIFCFLPQSYKSDYHLFFLILNPRFIEIVPYQAIWICSILGYNSCKTHGMKLLFNDEV